MTCDLNPSADQRQILDAAAAVLEDHYPVSRRRMRQEDDLSELAAFGAFALAVPETEGGAGFGLVEETLMHVLLGRHLLSPRALAAAVAARLAAEAGDRDLAAAIGAGAAPVCAAVATRSGMLLIDRAGARLALLFGNRALRLLDIGDAAGEPAAGLGRSVAVERMAEGTGRVRARAGEGAVLDIADLLVSAQLLGIAETARDLAVAYAQVRHQFGQPIGGFQAIKHHCADMAIAAEMVSALLDTAAIAVRDGRADAAFQLAALRRLAPAAALDNARTAVQVHGGIGFSAEADVHHYLKQAHVLSRLGQPADILSLPAPLTPYTRLAERT